MLPELFCSTDRGHRSQRRLVSQHLAQLSTITSDTVSSVRDVQHSVNDVAAHTEASVQHLADVRRTLASTAQNTRSTLAAVLAVPGRTEDAMLSVVETYGQKMFLAVRDSNNQNAVGIEEIVSTDVKPRSDTDKQKRNEIQSLAASLALRPSLHRSVLERSAFPDVAGRRRSAKRTKGTASTKRTLLFRRTFLSYSIELSLTLSTVARRSVYSPNLEIQRVVPDNAPAFRLLNQFYHDPIRLFDNTETYLALRELSQNGQASALDVNTRGESLVEVSKHIQLPRSRAYPITSNHVNHRDVDNAVWIILRNTVLLYQC